MYFVENSDELKSKGYDLEQLPRCENKQKRLNLKSKRKRNLIKKAIELSQMLDMDIFMVLKCRDTGKVTQFESGGCIVKGSSNPSGHAHFTIEKAKQEIQAWRDQGRVIKEYRVSDYNKLKLVKENQVDFEEDEHQVQSVPVRAVDARREKS